MAQLIELKLVNEAGTPQAWPGTESLVQLNLIDSVDPVWIGVSADGLTNQAYPVSTPLATITGTWPRVYQGIQVVINGQTNIYNNGELDYQRRAAACCIAPHTDDSPGESPSPEVPFDIMMLFNTEDPDTLVAFWTTFFASSQFFVDWGDGSPVEEYNSDNVTPEHTYAAPGEYTARILFTTPTDLATFELVNTPVLSSIAFGADTNWPALATINLQGNALTDGDVDFENMPSAIALVLADNQFTNGVLALIEDLYTTLNLSGNNFGTIDLSQVGSNVGNLYINNCGLSALDLTGLAGLVFPLTELQAGNNNLTEFITADFDSSNLTTLLLGDNDIDDFAIGDMNLANLTILDLQGNSLISANVDAILQALDAEGLNGGQVNLVNQDPAAPPGIGGSVAQGSLEGKGWTVTVDS